VTAFIIACAAMLAAALLWIVLPLLRTKSAEDGGSRKERGISAVAVAVLVPALAIGLYATLSNWDWAKPAAAAAQEQQMDDLLQKLQARLAENPNDVEGWLLLGRSYATVGRFALAVDAFQNAYDRSSGENVEAIVGLGEALVMTDEASLAGRAGKLFDAALAKAPNHPKALWYGSIAALQAGDLRRGRDRLQLLLAQNPPEQLRSVLERQIQDLDQQLSEAGQGAPAAQRTPAAGQEGPSATAQRSIKVAVSLAPQVREQLKSGALPLFILARDPAAGGPPLAVQRHSSSDLPITVELSERDAMIATRTIAGVPRVQVVARLSRSGTPQARSGDLYGEAEYDFSKNAGPNAGTLNIIIDRTVP
jgi:cytochrome c-type biogenesis protein CcmH